jgi:ATP-dependent Clp protease adaptor protein ClpS
LFCAFFLDGELIPALRDAAGSWRRVIGHDSGILARNPLPPYCQRKRRPYNQGRDTYMQCVGTGSARRRKERLSIGGDAMLGCAARLQAGDDRGNGPGRGTAVISRPKTKTKKPSLYRVLILNDDYTPMEFVVHVLERFFQKNRDDATRIMLHVHNHGVGECGVYTFEVAETKVTQVMDFARQHQHPLQCVMEKK